MAAQLNPYAPPNSHPEGVTPALPPELPDSDALLRALDAHFADSSAIRDEERLDGRWLRLAAKVLVPTAATAIGAFALFASYTIQVSTDTQLLTFLAACITIVPALWLGTATALQPSRGRRRAPVVAAKAFYRALTHGRGGFLNALIAPPTRGGEIGPPTLTPVVTFGQIGRIDKPGLRAWAQSFAASSGEYDRRVHLSGYTVAQISDRVADVSVRATVHGCARSALATFMGGAIFAQIHYYMKRQTWRGGFSLRMVRAPDGVWYVAHPWPSPHA
jgi:hypothetical protein